jgi:CheY-like chemotaxis protein/anti-sigma regulatory factor (Ser/Thr protein kinase)
LAAKEKAEESDRLKSAFLANMSHEIRTPMNGILGFADLLKTPNLSGEKQKEYIQIIEKGGEWMLNTINNLVNISKIESGLMEVSFSETNVEKQLQFIYIFFKPEAERSGLQLILNSSLTAEESMVITDQEKLYAILTNLVKNALKYSEKGFIEMGCSTQITAETRPVVSLRFYVKDTGIGIAKDRQEAIFERFVQADIADHEARQGSGLGLSIARSYVEMLGGTIGVESEEGKGSNFFFTIPHHSIPSKAIDIKTITRSTLSEQNQKQFTILIAEDDEISEKFLSVTIGKFARTIFRTKTGTETVEICRSHPEIDLILMDIQMPELNGYEATAQIRHFNKNVIIVAQTAFALAGDKEKALAAGCNDYVSKPIKENVINDIIIKYLNLEI